MTRQDQSFIEERGFIQGKCVAILFRNNTNFYTVIRVKISETNETVEEDSITMVGMMPELQDTDEIIAYGHVVTHPKFGRQYQVHQISKARPSTEQGLIQYFSSSVFKGIGKKTAKKIVEILGTDAVDQILADENILLSKVGLKPKQVRTIVQVLKNSEDMNGILLRFTKYQIPMHLASKILEQYKEETWEIIEENPYRLVEDIEGISFAKADEIGHMLGFSETHKYRIYAAMIEVLKRETFGGGHTYLSVDELFDLTNRILSLKLSDEQMLSWLEDAVLLGKIFLEDACVFLPAAAFAEIGIFQGIQKKLDESIQIFLQSEIMQAIGNYEEMHQITFALKQQEAIELVLQSPISIITGGPGTGKTTVIRGVLEVFKQLHGLMAIKQKALGIFLCAPTGRAAKRLSEATGLHAVTIHRLLGYNPDGAFTYGEDQKLEGRLLIVDEVSMVDIFLAYQLFKAIPHGMQVVFVGDEDQLPSVGPGLVLKDMLRSERIPFVRLNQIYRQSENSTIIDLAYAINEGRLTDDLLRKSKDFSFISRERENLPDAIIQICENALRKGYDPKEIQVLAPMYRGDVGIDALNQHLQNLFNPPMPQRKELQYGDRLFRVGDKVLQLVNVPENNVYNGDFGEIVSITEAEFAASKQDEMIVSFEGIEVSYTRADFMQLTHAYCCSIHKSQGSEFKLVVLPISHSYVRMLKRNLIYTAVTRSKEFLVLCGSIKTLYQGIKNTSANERRTTLGTRFCSLDAKVDESVQKISIEKQAIKQIERPLVLTEEYIFSEKMAVDELKRMENFPLYTKI